MGDKKKALHCLHRIALRSSAHSLAPGEERNVQNAAPSLRLHTQPLGWACSEKQLLELQALFKNHSTPEVTHLWSNVTSERDRCS